MLSHEKQEEIERSHNCSVDASSQSIVDEAKAGSQERGSSVSVSMPSSVAQSSQSLASQQKEHGPRDSQA